MAGKSRKRFLKIHRWLGLTSGLVVFMLGVTGCIFAFEKEISDIIYKDFFYVKSESGQPLPVSRLLKIAQDTMGKDRKIARVITARDKKRSWIFQTYKTDTASLTYFGEYVYYDEVYVDPYTGKILKIEDRKMEFFNLVKMLHYSLWLKIDIGRPIVGTATLIFFVMLITGFVLWWPGSKNKNAIRQRFTIKWNARFKRLNYDLHNVMGFYALTFSSIIAFTGLIMAFRWIMILTYAVASWSVTPPAYHPFQKKDTASQHATVMDEALHHAKLMYPDAANIAVYMPKDKDTLLNVYISENEGRYDKTNLLVFHAVTGAPVKAQFHKLKNNGEKLVGMNYDIHVGAILGLPGKIIAFSVSFICATLPITGFIIWWGRKNKKDKTKRKLPVKPVDKAKALAE